MKQLKRITMLVFVIFAVACKTKNKSETKEINNKEEVTSSQSVNKEVESTFFQIEIVYQALSNDVFQVFYTSLDSTEPFSAKSMVKKNVSALADYSTVAFKLPKDVLPYKLRIDLGENKKQGEIKIKEIKLKYDDNEIAIQKELIPQFFVTNEFLKFDSKTGVFKTTVVKNRYDPFLVSTPLLNQKIELEL